MSKIKLAFTLIELLVTLTIVGILTGLSISGYMDNLRRERRKDAILSLQKVWININTTPVGSVPKCQNNMPYGISDTNCLSTGGLYIINYNPNGFALPPGINVNQLQNNENLILKATAVHEGQKKDLGCATIYLSSEDRIYPESCYE